MKHISLYSDVFLKMGFQYNVEGNSWMQKLIGSTDKPHISSAETDLIGQKSFGILYHIFLIIEVVLTIKYNIMEKIT